MRQLACGIVIVFACTPAFADFGHRFVWRNHAYELRATPEAVRLLKWESAERDWKAVPINPGVAHLIVDTYLLDSALSPSGYPILLLSHPGPSHSIWRLAPRPADGEVELMRLWTGSVDAPLNFSVARDDVIVIGSDRPTVIADRGQCQLPDRFHGYNAATKADGLTIFFNATLTMVAAVDLRTCRVAAVTDRKFSRFIVDMKPHGNGWVAVMGSTTKSFVVLLDRRGRVTHEYEIPSQRSRYSLISAENGLLIGGEGTPIFAYDGRSLRRVDAPPQSRAIEGSSLHDLVVMLGDEIVRVKLGKEMPGRAVRGLWVGAATLIVDLQIYIITIATGVVIVVALLAFAGRRLTANRVVPSDDGRDDQRR